MDNIYYELINDGKIFIDYLEDEDGSPQLAIHSNDEELMDSLDFIDFQEYVAKCLLVASMAGFEAPTEYYKVIKDMVMNGVQEESGKQND